jgi:hypothetical protein
MYAIENEDCEHVVWMIHNMFIAHESCLFIESGAKM